MMIPWNALWFFLSVLPHLCYAVPATTKISKRAPDNSYIVVLKDIPESTLSKHLSWVNDIHENSQAVENRTKPLQGPKQQYSFGHFKGYAGEFSESTIALNKESDDVAYVEKDGIAQVTGCVGQNITAYPINIWGLGRISHCSNGPWSEYIYNGNFSFCTDYFKGYAYVLDSGITVTHSELARRSSWIFKADPAWTYTDNCGHGTHVAATIAGRTYGVMKRARIYGVKVVDGSGSGIIQSVLQAVNAAIQGGLTVVVSAGNIGVDACTFTPAAASDAITVGATDHKDAVAEFSNTGCCVDIFAPGTDILSAYIPGDTANAILPGTSMVAAHVAGLVLYNKCRYNLTTPAQGYERLTANGSANVGLLSGGLCTDCCAPNKLAWNGGCER
ncbi:proteinase B [Rhizina undulata]